MKRTKLSLFTQTVRITRRSEKEIPFFMVIPKPKKIKLIGNI